jgi:FixJ family two-component response regulator
LLKRDSWEVLTASDGDEALQIFVREAGRVAVVLTDVRMPVMSGFELIAALRGIVKQSIGVIFITGCGTVEMAIRFFREADDLILAINFLEKPCDGAEIIAAIEEGLRCVNHTRTILDRMASLTGDKS